MLEIGTKTEQNLSREEVGKSFNKTEQITGVQFGMFPSREELATPINCIYIVFSREELIIQQKEPTCSVDSLLFNYACDGVSPKSFTKITQAINSASTDEKLVELAIVMVSVPLVLMV